MSTPTPVPRDRTMLYFAVGVAAAVVVLVVVLVVAPASPGSSAESASGAVLTFSQAHGVANGTVAGFQGGGWTLLAAGGVVSATNATLSPTATELGNLSSYCTLTPLTGSTSLTVPSFLGNRSSGESPAWEFGYRNLSGGIALVTVTNGHASVLATLSGFECAIASQLIHAVPGGALDSPRAATIVRPLAAPFLAAHPNASAVLGLFGGYSYGGRSVPAEWSIVYSTCAVSSTPRGTGSQFNATLNAVTGQVLGWNTTDNASCGQTTSGPLTAAPLPEAPIAPAAALLTARCDVDA